MKINLTSKPEKDRFEVGDYVYYPPTCCVMYIMEVGENNGWGQEYKTFTLVSGSSDMKAGDVWDKHVLETEDCRVIHPTLEWED